MTVRHMHMYGPSNNISIAGSSPGITRMIDLSEKMISAISEETGATYTHGTSVGYETAGTARDWFFSEDANELNQYRSASFTLELRPEVNGTYAFFLPADQVSPLES